MLAEATTLHQRFPYAVMGGLFVFDEGAERDGTGRRPSTVVTAHEYFRAFDGRGSQANAVEKFEALGIVLYRAIEPLAYRYFDAGSPALNNPSMPSSGACSKGWPRETPPAFGSLKGD